MGQSPCSLLWAPADVEESVARKEELEAILDELVERVANKQPEMHALVARLKQWHKQYNTFQGIIQKLEFIASVVAALAESSAQVEDEVSRGIVREVLTDVSKELDDRKFSEATKLSDPNVVIERLARLQNKLHVVLITVTTRQSSCQSCIPRQLAVQSIEPSQLQLGDLGPSDLLGRGFFQVYRGTLLRGRQQQRPSEVAVKVFEHSQLDVQKLWDSVEANSRLQMDSCHANVLEILGLCRNHPLFPRAVLLVTPFIGLGSIFRVLFAPVDRGSEAEMAKHVLGVPLCTAQVLFGVASALEYMHSCHPPVLHLDLKAENVLLKWAAGPVAGEPVEQHLLVAQVCDFKAARSYRSLTGRGVRGTNAYVAPERWQHKEGAESPAADAFAFGLLLYEVSSRRLAFEQLMDYQIMTAVCNEPRMMPIFDTRSPCYNPRYESLAQRCWVKDPKHRVTMREVAREVESIAREEESRQALRGCMSAGTSLEVLRCELTRALDVIPGGDDLLHGAALKFVSELRQRGKHVVAEETETLVSALRALPNSEAVQEQACGAVRDLCAVSDAQDAKRCEQVVEFGVLEALVATVHSQHFSAAVQENAFGALRNICGGTDGASGNRKQRAADAGAIEALVTGLRAHPDSLAVQAAGCGALQNLCVGGATRKQRAAEAGAIEVLVKALNTHRGSGTVQERSCAALRNICIGTDVAGAGRARRATEAGALEAVVQAMQDLPLSAQVQEKGCAVLRNICVTTDALSSSRADRAVNAGAFKVLVTALTTHRSNATVQEQVCAALHNLCGGTDAAGAQRAKKATKAGALEALMATARAHPNSTAVQGRAMAAIRKMCAGAESTGDATLSHALELLPPDGRGIAGSASMGSAAGAPAAGEAAPHRGGGSSSGGGAQAAGTAEHRVPSEGQTHSEDRWQESPSHSTNKPSPYSATTTRSDRSSQETHSASMYPLLPPAIAQRKLALQRAASSFSTSPPGSPSFR